MQIIEGLVNQFGSLNLDRKITDYRALGTAPHSVIVFRARGIST
jgi:hypothetical protein